MISVEEKTKTGGLVNGAGPLLEEMVLKEFQDHSGARKSLNSELWHTCAGPLVSLPQLGSLVYYFPQGHSEQVAISTKRTVSSHIPNYPNLPSQLLCQVHNVTLHADKETDEIYAQMSLQPVNSEKDVFPVPDFGIKTSKHPSQFFCKTLTASDTSTHGGFSVPRRAAEKLFPQLDYSMQPPTQELVVRDLHDCTWTFRHIYRGQPKRHLLTTGWSSFVGAKRLKAGDTVLFIRDEKSQLLLGIRRANRQQTALPSSVLSADSMHIGVLAAAAHAAANRVPFTIFYNPRACPSEFVIPMAKYQKAVYGPQVSIGMRFGMMFETEESGKRRYMGTIVGISDLDPLRWPTSKWRNLQVEWDEPGSGEKQSRISLWDVETPESLFIFPSLTSSLKRSFHPGYAGADTDWMKMIKRPLMRVPENGCVDLTYPPIPNIASEQLIKMLLKPQGISTFGAFPSNLPACVIKNSPSIEKETNTHPLGQQNPQLLSSLSILPKNQNPPHNYGDQLYTMDASLVPQKYVFGNFQPLDKSEDQFPTKSNTEKPEIETIASNTYPHQIEAPLMETSNPTSLLPYPSHIPLPYLDTEDWGSLSAIPEVGQEMWDSQMNYLRILSQPGQITPFTQPNSTSLHGVSNSCGMRDFSEESNDQSEIFSDLHFDASNGGGSSVIDPSSSSAVLEGFSSMSDTIFQQPDCLMGNFSSNQDVQSQITSASLTDSHGFSLQEFPDSSGGTSSSNVDFDENSLLQKGLWQQITPPLRTYTKVQKLGSVGRSIDVTRFKNYEELRSAISCMFGLEGLLDDPRGSGWKLVYVDYENDVLLVGDDPWEEFVSCVRCIRILSPSEVEQMSENGMQLLNGPVMRQGNENSLSEDGRAWDGLT